MSVTIQIETKTARKTAIRCRNIDAHMCATGFASARDEPTDLVATNFRLVNRVSTVASEVYYGEHGWREWLDDLLVVFAEGARYSVDEIIEACDAFVVASFSIRGRGAYTAHWIDLRWTGVTWFRDGQAVRTVVYPSREEALTIARR